MPRRSRDAVPAERARANLALMEDATYETPQITDVELEDGVENTVPGSYIA